MNAVESYQSNLLAFAMGYVKDLDRARDVVQDTFIRLADQEPAAVAEGLKGWLFTVCRNRALDVLRREKRWVTAAEVRTEDEGDFLTASPRQEMWSRERGEILRGLVEGLPEKQRVCVQLRYEKDLSYQEISDRTGLSVSNVGFILHQALRALRQKMGVGEVERRGQ